MKFWFRRCLEDLRVVLPDVGLKIVRPLAKEVAEAAGYGSGVHGWDGSSWFLG